MREIDPTIVAGAQYVEGGDALRRRWLACRRCCGTSTDSTLAIAS